MELNEIIVNRRSIRRYKPIPVEQEKLLRIIEAARLAPSWKNLQCWKFIVVEDPRRKEGVISAFPEDNPGRKALAAAPVLIVLCADPQASGVQDGKDYYLVDSGIAMEHLVLAAANEGLATCWMALFDEQTLKEALSIPENIRVVALTPVGYGDQEPKPRPRKSIEEITFKDAWGQPVW